MGAHGNAMLAGQGHRVAHRAGIASMEAAGDIGRGQVRHQSSSPGCRRLFAALSPTSPFKSMRIASPYTLVISSTFLKAQPGRKCGFLGEFVRHAGCPQELVSVCGLRHEAVNAGGSQAGIPGRGAFGRPILFFSVQGPFCYTPAPSGYSRASFSSRASDSTVVPLPLPGAIRLEPQIADAAAPRGDDAADGAEVGPVDVLLIEAAGRRPARPG